MNLGQAEAWMPTQYKDYVLTMLFVKYVSDKYANKPNSLIEVPKEPPLKIWWH